MDTYWSAGAPGLITRDHGRRYNETNGELQIVFRSGVTTNPNAILSTTDARVIDDIRIYSNDNIVEPFSLMEAPIFVGAEFGIYCWVIRTPR